MSRSTDGALSAVERGIVVSAMDKTEKVNILKQFGEAVRTLRVEKKLTQEQLAKRTELHRTYIGDVERGGRNVSLVNLIRIARGLEVRPSDLLKSFPLERFE